MKQMYDLVYKFNFIALRRKVRKYIPITFTFVVVLSVGF